MLDAFFEFCIANGFEGSFKYEQDEECSDYYKFTVSCKMNGVVKKMEMLISKTVLESKRTKTMIEEIMNTFQHKIIEGNE